MPTCDSCGFDSVVDGEPCPLCGSDHKTVIDESVDFSTLHRRPAGSRRFADYPDGTVYASRYRIDAFLGRGGMGTVYRVHDQQENRTAALKILHAQAADDEAGLERFRREITILSRLRHPAVPPIFGWGVEGADPYFVAEYIEGSNLRDEIRRRGAWVPAEAAAMMATVADALHIAHEKGVIHRDVKPHNIMLASDGSIRLLDFGVARGVGIDLKTITATGAIVGTPEYMSPEQFDSHRVDARSDVYSLGVVLFELLTGELPFTGDTPLSIAIKHKSEPPPAPRTRRKEIPAWLDRIVLRCLEKDPTRRFQDASALAAELRRARTGGAPKRTRLATGDWVVEDPGETTEWALVLESMQEKVGWLPGMALRYGSHFYRLAEAAREPGASRWTYRFVYWPSEEIFRGMVDYDQDAAERIAQKAKSLGSKLRKLW